METAGEAYKALIREVLDAPTTDTVTSTSTIGSSWGTAARPFREKIGASLIIPAGQNLLTSAGRPINEPYSYAQAAWTLLGRADLETMKAFNPRAEAFSADGKLLCAAFGARIRKQGPDQLAEAITLLKTDPTTRRAIMLIGRETDLQDDLPDFPCATSIHLLQRQEQLHAVISMRSQSLVGVFPYDLINFAYIQQYAANELGIEIGPTHWQFGSAHIYEDETHYAQLILDDETLTFKPLPLLPQDEDGLETLLTAWTNPQTRQHALQNWQASTGRQNC